MDETSLRDFDGPMSPEMADAVRKWMGEPEIEVESPEPIFYPAWVSIFAWAFKK